MKVFQIGFNKCGTRSLFQLFKTAGYKSVHWERGEIARDIQASVQVGTVPLSHWHDVVLFCDMESVNRPKQPLIEAYRHFAYLNECFPDAKFILNTRDREDWLFSRVDHNNGNYLKFYRRHFGLTRTREVMDRWRSDWDAHIAAVREYFLDRPGKLLEFDIVRDDIEKLHAFFQPELDLSKGIWGQLGQTGKGRPEIMKTS